MPSDENISREEQLEFINKLKAKVKSHKTVQNMFDEYDVDIDEFDLIPVAFSDLDVSARTARGAVYLNYKLLSDKSFEEDDHYLVHEFTHWLQQTTGNTATQSSDDGDYLKNPYEQEGFQNQTEYIAETQSPEEAEDYVEQVLDHHDEDGKEREDKKKKLLARKNLIRRICKPTQIGY